MPTNNEKKVSATKTEKAAAAAVPAKAAKEVKAEEKSVETKVTAAGKASKQEEKTKSTDTEKKAAAAKSEKKAEPKASKSSKSAGTDAKKAAKATAKKSITSELHIQFSGKSYTEAELIKIAKDVWRYDLKRKVSDFESVQLYVKPEESACYYVINNEVADKFQI